MRLSWLAAPPSTHHPIRKPNPKQHNAAQPIQAPTHTHPPTLSHPPTHQTTTLDQQELADELLERDIRGIVRDAAPLQSEASGMSFPEVDILVSFRLGLGGGLVLGLVLGLI